MAILIPKGADLATRLAIQKSSARQVSGLTPDRLVYWHDGHFTTVDPLTSWIAGTANEIAISDDGDGTVTIGLVDPLIVSKGGSGAATFTDHSILLGSGTDAFTALGAATNGQLPIGSTGNDPALSTLTEGTGITITNGAGLITLATNDSEIDHDSLSNFAANEHFLQTAITNVSTALSTGILKVTTGTGALSSVAGISGSLVLDDGTTERVTLTFTDGVLTDAAVGAAVALLINWTGA